MKRLLDLGAAVVGLVIGSLVLIPAMIAVWLQDGHSPFYIANRVGRGGRPFQMVKLRSMRVLADRTGVSSTASDDPRITRIGRFIRRWKLDELTQLWNVLRGHMSLVGPRPQVEAEVRRYTAEERGLLSVRPGITDLASIVFSDEAEILRGAPDPDLRYDQVIRPWKSRLGLLYVRKGGAISLDVRIVALTLLSVVNRPAALAGVAGIVRQLDGDAHLQEVAARSHPLRDASPPGSSEVVRSREATPAA
ncbi:MAG: sugar transferase [Acidobacteria bacterium]|nr:sugar transferase [Acidobacteriota bacterium]